MTAHSGQLSFKRVLLSATRPVLLCESRAVTNEPAASQRRRRVAEIFQRIDRCSPERAFRFSTNANVAAKTIRQNLQGCARVQDTARNDDLLRAKRGGFERIEDFRETIVGAGGRRAEDVGGGCARCQASNCPAKIIRP